MCKGKHEDVELDTVITVELKKEGGVRELIREIQGVRKQQGFELNDTGAVTISGSSEFIAVVTEYKKDIESQTNMTISFGATQAEMSVEVQKN